MNVLRFLLLSAIDRAEQFYEYVMAVGLPEIQRRMGIVYRQFNLAILAAAIVLVSGVLIGHFASKDVGRGILCYGGLIVTTGILIVWIQMRAYTKLIEVAAAFAHRLNLPLAADIWGAAYRIPRWVSGLAAWFTIALTYSMIVPIWRYPTLTAITAVAGMGIAYAVAAEWFSGKLGRYVGMAFLMLGFLTATVVQFVRPEILRSGSANAERVIDGVETNTERTEAMNGIAKSAERAANVTDQGLLTQKMAERNSMREHSIKFCRGEFCTPTDRERAAALDKDIADLRDGTYWSKRAVVQPTPTASASATTTAPPVVVPPPTASATVIPPASSVDARRAAAAQQLNTLYGDDL